MSFFSIKNLVPSFLLNSKNYFLVLLNLEGDIVFQNKAFTSNFTSENEANFKLSSFRDLYNETNYTQYLDAHKFCMENPNRVVSKNLFSTNRISLQTAATTWEFSALLDSETHVIGILCIGHTSEVVENGFDELPKKQVLIEETEERLSKIIEAIPLPFLLLDDSYSIKRTNKEFEAVFGYSHDEVEGRNIDFLIPSRFRPNHAKLQQSYMDSGGPSMRMGRFLPALNKNGDEIIVESSINTFKSGDKKYIIVIFQDVTKTKHDQDTILKQNETLQSIAYHQSHTLRNPVSRILGICELVEVLQASKFEVNFDYLSEIHKSTYEIDKIIRTIDDFTNLNK